MIKVLFRLNVGNHFKHSTSGKLMMSLVEDLNVVTSGNLKRLQQDISDDVTVAKKACVEVDRVKRKKIAMLVVYSGQGYLGLQRNPGRKTIEEELMVALFKSKIISEEVFNQPQIIQFQRAARTDKGVSAIRQILSMKLPEEANVNDINIHLPPQIRAIAIRRVTKGFNCKSACDARTYSYMLPTFAFSPHNESIKEDFRAPPEVMKQVNEILRLYEGTHNFHNFTSRKLPQDPSAIRFMINLVCGEPFIVDDIEFAIIKIKGQSFMLHQIRKMIGLLISVVRGFTTTDTITRAWEIDRLDIPMAPGLGLLLEEVHYDRYNQRYGSDGIHEPLEWSSYETEIEEFKKKYILPTIVEEEKNEKSMLQWMETLHMHSFNVRKQHMSDAKEEVDDDSKPKENDDNGELENTVSSSNTICDQQNPEETVKT